MDFTVIEANKNHVIFFNFDSGALSTFKFDLHLPFDPDFMIVRGINYYTVGAVDNPGLYLIQSDITYEILGSFVIENLVLIGGGNPASLNNNSTMNNIMYYKISKPLRGTFNINITTDKAGTPGPLNGKIAIHLDFVKFKSQKPQLVY